MAILHAQIYSDCLKRTVPVTVLLPVDQMTNGIRPPEKPLRTVYLLHGLLGDENDWVSMADAAVLSAKHGVAIVMPAGENSFYVDGPHPWQRYGAYVGQELVEVTRRMFPLSRRREDTCLAGLSMGGFGALRNGFRYAETFGYVAALSAALNAFEAQPDTPGFTLFGEYQVFGNLAEAKSTDMNPRVALADAIERGAPLPKVYMACGLRDSLFGVNMIFQRYLSKQPVHLTWRTSPDAHTWTFWTKQLYQVMEWLQKQ